MFLVMSTSGVMAVDGTIHFTGSITDQACNIDTGSQDMDVDLGNVSKSAINGSVGIKAAPTKFSLKLTSCPSTISGATVKFDGTADNDNQDLLMLDNEAGVATGVGIEIADKNGSTIPLHTASMNYPLVEGENSLDFIARYVSTKSSVTTGPANGTSQFTINYK
ncbi:type 1 fimbrial protein [Salmonella enterica]|nr:type 1 fimbrial protein [Salmonella enterica]